MKIVTPNRLRSGLLQVRQELRRLGFLSPAVSKVRVRLTAFGTAYGYQYYGGSGEIHIPALSLSRFSTFLGYPYTALRDVIRHEYGHAVADQHRGLMRSRKFLEPAIVLKGGKNSTPKSTSQAMQPIRPERILQKPS